MILCALISIFSTIFILGVLLKLYLIYSCKWCANKVRLDGKTVIVTGGNTGIGFQSALEFARRGAKVILGCRDKAKAEEARVKILEQTQNHNIFVKLVDFSSLQSVKNFVQEIGEREEKVDILVNNAGAGGLKQKITEDGLQIMMQVNYFGPVLLTLLLLDLLKKAPKARIINVSSLLALKGNLDANDLDKYEGMMGSYMNAKLGNILFTKELAKKLRRSNVTVYSLHPGAIKTDIFRRLKGWRKTMLDVASLVYFKSPEAGAQTTIYTATEPNIERFSGRHFEECNVVSDYKSARNDRLAETLWKRTLEVLRIDFM